MNLFRECTGNFRYSVTNARPAHPEVVVNGSGPGRRIQVPFVPGGVQPAGNRRVFFARPQQKRRPWSPMPRPRDGMQDNNSGVSVGLPLLRQASPLRVPSSTRRNRQRSRNTHRHLHAFRRDRWKQQAVNIVSVRTLPGIRPGKNRVYLSPHSLSW